MAFALIALVSMLVVLGIMVLVHEFGHFAVAKLFGVRVEVFRSASVPVFSAFSAVTPITV